MNHVRFQTCASYCHIVVVVVVVVVSGIQPTPRLWLKAVTEPNSAIHTAIAEWTRPESTKNDGSVRFFDTGI